MKRLLNMQQTSFMYSQSEIKVTKGNKSYLPMKRLLNMQQTSFMYSQSEIKVTKGSVVNFTRSRENNSIERESAYANVET